MTDRLDDIKSKITKLSRMTIENGCSENEAIAAASKISELLAAHGMTMAEVRAFGDSKSDMEMAFTGINKRNHESSLCAAAISRYFGCKSFIRRESDRRKGTMFFGFPDDVAAAVALLELIRYSMEKDFRGWLMSQDRNDGVHGKTHRRNFMAGYAMRVSARLNEMSLKKEMAQRTTGRELVVLKEEIIAAAFEKQIGKLGRAKKRSFHRTAAFEAGERAGSSVGLNKEIE